MGGSSSAPPAGRPAQSAEERYSEAKGMFERANAKFEQTPLSAAGVRALRDRGERVVLVDVRSAEERGVSVIQGSISEAEFWQAGLESYRGAHVVGYCTIGFRSGMFAQKLKSKGLENVYNGEGVVLWTHDAKAPPLVSRDDKGRETPVQRVHTYGDKWDLASEEYKTCQFGSPARGHLSTAWDIATRWFR